MVKEGKNFETQRREGVETRRHEEKPFLKTIMMKRKMLPTLNH
jgi:hypothetical protein